MESVAFIQWCLDHLNYWTITLLMAIESSFIPFPSEVVIPPAAYKAASGNSELNVYLVVLSATIGANIGALINYYLAYFVGRPIVYKFANSRFGHMCLIDEAKKMKQQAIDYGHSQKRELSFLCIHGLLHLLGYDHTLGEKEEKEMFDLQKEILDEKGIIN